MFVFFLFLLFCGLSPDSNKLIVWLKTRRALGRAHLPPTTVFRRLKTMRRCCDGHGITMPNTCTSDFPDVIKFRVAVRTMSEKEIRFRHPDYDRIGLKSWSVRPCPDTWRHAKYHPNPCTRFWVILLTDRQTDKQTSRAIAFTSSFVGGKLCQS